MLKDNSSELGRVFWQFELNGVPLLPRLLTWGRVGDLEGQWWLKVWGERLLFCATSAPKEVFAVVTPCHSETGLVEFWSAAIERGDWGQVYLHEQSLANAEETSTGFITIYAPNKIAWTREWCGDKWMALEDLNAGLVSEWLANSRQEWDSPFNVADEHLQSVLSREFSAAERPNQSLFWLRGSRAEWKRVLQACATAYFASSATSSQKRRLTSGDNRFYGFAHAPFCTGWMDGLEDLEDESWLLPTALRQLFTRSFVFIGWSWSRRSRQPENLRAGWKVKPSVISAKVEFTLSPSQHEILEAQLTLRDWLRGKVPDEQIAALLK